MLLVPCFVLSREQKHDKLGREYVLILTDLGLLQHCIFLEMLNLSFLNKRLLYTTNLAAYDEAYMKQLMRSERHIVRAQIMMDMICFIGLCSFLVIVPHDYKNKDISGSNKKT